MTSTSLDTNALADHLFRREAGKMVAALTRLFGPRYLELAEDVVQETLLKALKDWPFRGVPDQPAAWLHRVARNLAIDHLRRHARGLELLKENAALLRSEWTLSLTVNSTLDEATINDDQLRMMFACCHPTLPAEQQVALALKTLCGFGVPEIARAFLTNEETINKRMYRAREAFRKLGRLDLPAHNDLPARLGQVLSTIYLLFNEGYKAARHRDLVREDLIEEALRLCRLLLDNPSTALPNVHALMALMVYHAARSDARVDTHGEIILLQDQDRSLWDRELIALANHHLDQASLSDRSTSYPLEAAIAASHANAPTYADTDWTGIIRLYDELFRRNPSPIVALNRAIAFAERDGADRGLQALTLITGLEEHHLFHAVRGELMIRTGDHAGAHLALEQALLFTDSPAERHLLEQKLARLTKG